MHLPEVAKTLPAGYGYEFSGLSRQEIKAGNSTVIIFALSIVFVFLFLAALYESWQVLFQYCWQYRWGCWVLF